MEYIQGHGWVWQSGLKVYQEDMLIPGTSIPIGWKDYGRVESPRIESHGDGYWVMDRLGSVHRHPFRTEAAAERYFSALREGITISE